MNLRHISLAILLATASGSAAADTISQLQNLGQQEFRALSEDLGAALSYKPLAPTAPLGVTGFDIGVAVTATRVRNSELFNRISSSGDFPATIVVPSVRVAKGLPFGIDASLMYSAVPKTGIKLWGGALSWAFVPGDTLLPAFGVRASHTRLNGVEQLDFHTTGLDASLSKGFGPLTPYAGAGKVWSTSTPSSSTGLQRESFSQTKVFAGLGFNIALLNVGVEYDRTGGVNTYGAKLGLKF
jgi:hypothetical protein